MNGWDDEPTLPLARSTFSLPTCVLDGGHGTRSYACSPIRIGKDPTNDFVLTDLSCSRFHAVIQHTGQGYLIRDLDSTNGVWVSGVRVREAWLEPGAELRLGEERVHFRPEVEVHRVAVSTKERLGGMVGRSQAMRRVFDLVERVAATDATLLVLGETGTGKEVLARTVHDLSRRSKGPFSVVDCSAIPEGLIESELFGHERGAFTGAVSVRSGLFEEADGGTLFLDEVGELPLSVQPKLLRVLERGEFRRVGGSRVLRTEARLIAATHRNLFAEVEAGRFRQDLLYRLHVIPIRLPALRERSEDIEPLVEFFLDRMRKRSHAPLAVQGVAGSFFDALRDWGFPGNVRELANLLEREVALSEGPVLTRLRIPLGDGTLQRSPVTNVGTGTGPLPSYREAKEGTLEEFHRAYLGRLMRQSGGSISGAARMASMERKQVRGLLRELGLEGLATRSEDGTREGSDESC